PTLLKAIAYLKEKNQTTRLIILGDGKERRALQAQIAELGINENVIMPGFQLNPYTWMAASQLYVMSSRYEGFPNSLVQALACGTPVVSCDCPTGPREILEDGKWGQLVPVGN